MDEVYTKSGNSTPAGEDRAAYCEYMMEVAGGAMKFETRAKKVFGHKPAATMVRQLLFWDGKGSDPEGYIYKTYPKWWDEEGLTRTEIDTARHKLGPDKFGVLEEDRKGVFNRLHYRLNLERLWQVMFPELDPPTAEDPVPEDQTLNHDFTVQDSDSLECRVPVVQSAGMVPSHNREYSEITQENLSLIGADAPQEENQEVKGAGAECEPVPTTSLPTRPTEQQDPASPEAPRKEGLPSGKDLVTRMQARLKSQGYDLLSNEEARMYGSNFKKLMASDNPCREAMEELVDVLVDDWGRSYLASPQKIYREDVRGNYQPVEDDEDIEEVLAMLARLDDEEDDEENIEEVLASLDEDNIIPSSPLEDIFEDDEDAATGPEYLVPGLEEDPEWYTTPETVDGRFDALNETVDRILTESRDGAVVRLALAVVGGKRSPQGPITRENVAEALRDELDLSKTAALTAADQMIKAVRDEQEVRV